MPMLKELGTFISRIPKSYRISMPRLQSYLHHIYRNTDLLIEQNARFTNDPIPSRGIDYLNSLITRADITYLLKFENDVDRFTKIVREYQGANYSDFIRQYPIREKSFIFSHRGRTAEYLLITDDFDITEEIPFGSNNFDDWRVLRPIMMLSNDSPEIKLDIITSKFRYRKIPPKEAVFSINVVKLLALYTKYRLCYPEKFIDNTNNYPFIYEYCILPMLHDNVKTWITKIIYDIVILKTIDPMSKYSDSELTTGEESVFILGGRQSALIEIEDLITKCVSGKIKPDEVLVSLYIDKNTNMLGEINNLLDKHFIGNSGNQYRCGEFIREYFILSTMLRLYQLQPDSNRSRELRRVFNIVSKRLANTRFWTGIGNPFVASDVQMKFELIQSIMV